LKIKKKLQEFLRFSHFSRPPAECVSDTAWDRMIKKKVLREFSSRRSLKTRFFKALKLFAGQTAHLFSSFLFERFHLSAQRALFVLFCALLQIFFVIASGMIIIVAPDPDCPPVVKMKNSILHPYDLFQIDHTAFVTAIKISVQVFDDLVKLTVKAVRSACRMNFYHPQLRLDIEYLSDIHFCRLFLCFHRNVLFLTAFTLIAMFSRIHPMPPPFISKGAFS
jgi:hypothetical protein